MVMSSHASTSAGSSLLATSVKVFSAEHSGQEKRTTNGLEGMAQVPGWRGKLKGYKRRLDIDSRPTTLVADTHVHTRRGEARRGGRVVFFFFFISFFQTATSASYAQTACGHDCNIRCSCLCRFAWLSISAEAPSARGTTTREGQTFLSMAP